MNSLTKVERTSDRELVIRRAVRGPARLVFEAWRNPEDFKKWWIPKSAPITLVSCEMDVRTGGKYRLVFNAGDRNLAFFGRYLEVTPPSRLVWTNEEGGDDAANVTTASFEETNGTTTVTVHDCYPSKRALDDAIASESTGGWAEQLAQLEQLVARN